jgi:hypothetical protein
MASLDFPNTPSDGEKHPDPAVPGVGQWTYDSSKGIWTGELAGNSVTPGLFAPIFRNYDEQYGPETISAWAGWESDNNEQSSEYNNIFGPSGAVTDFTMPPEADRAIIIFYYVAKCQALPNTAIPGGIYAQFAGSLTFTGGNAKVINGGVQDNEISFGKFTHVYTEKTGTGSTAGVTNARFVSKDNSSKIAVLECDAGAKITATRDGRLSRAKKCEASCSAGRFVIYPYSSNSLFSTLIDSGVIQYNLEDDSNPVEGSSAEKLIAQSDLLKEEFKSVINSCDMTLRYDTTITEDDDRTFIETKLNAILALKRDLRSYEDIKVDFDQIVNDLVNSGLVSFNFNFEGGVRSPGLL